MKQDFASVPSANGYLQKFSPPYILSADVYLFPEVLKAAEARWDRQYNTCFYNLLSQNFPHAQPESYHILKLRYNKLLAPNTANQLRA